MKSSSKVFTALSGFLLLNFNVLLVDAAFPEPLCSKFAYEEQLLERMVRMEFYMEILEKELRKTVADAIVTLSEQYDGTVKNMLGHVNTPKVAFNAREATDLSLPANQAVVFKTVIMNEGGAYNNETGVFTAPVDGLYQFNAQLCVIKGKDLDYGIRIQKTAIISGECRTPSDADDGKCFSFSAVGRVQKGETVEVANVDGSSSTEDILYQNSNDWNAFSGVLISV